MYEKDAIFFRSKSSQYTIIYFFGFKITLKSENDLKTKIFSSDQIIAKTRPSIMQEI